MSSPKVLRVIANIVEVLPEAVARLACGGLVIVGVGSCTVMMIRDDPWSGVFLGAFGLLLVLPGLLRAIAKRMEARPHPPPRSPDVQDPDADLPDR